MLKRALLATLAILAAAAISSWGLFYFRDNFSTHFPLKVVSAAAYRDAEIPFWNSSAGGGQPLAGNPNALTFYPDNILYLLFPAHVAFNLHFLLHLALAFLAMRALCRETGSSEPAAGFVASLYAFSGLAISATAFYNLIAALALVPLAFCCMERFIRRPSFRESLCLGGACGLLGLVGEPVTVAGAAVGIGIIFIAGWTGARHESALVSDPPAAANPSRATPAPRLAIFGSLSIVAAMAIVSPQLIAFSEISHEVERSVHPFSTRSVLAASLPLWRIAEIVAGPFHGLITDLGVHGFHPAPGQYPPLFASLLVGGAVIPAAFRKSAARRYQLLAAIMLFLALGNSNPIVRAAVDSIGLLRFGRYPEKLALPLIVALFVLVGGWLTTTAGRRPLLLLICALPLPLVAFDLVRRSGEGSLDAVAAIVVAAAASALMVRAVPLLPNSRIAILMLVPLVYWGVRSLPIDRYAPYRDALAAASALEGHRVVVPANDSLSLPSAITTRDEYRTRARLIHPLFGMAGGIRYALDRSPEGMYSFLSRIAHERFSAAPPWLAARYAALAGCEAIVSHAYALGRAVPTIVAVPGTVPDACFIASALAAHSVQEAVQAIETPSFRPGVDAVIPAPGRRFAAGRVTSIARSGGRINLTVVCEGDALLRLGESYWSAWTAVAVRGTTGSSESVLTLRTLPVDLDRLGVIVPAGSWRVTVTFGRHRHLVAAAWFLSTVLAAAAAAAWRLRKSSAAPAR
jgi:hypothetical protein